MTLDAKIEPEAHADLGRLSPPLLAAAYALIVRLKDESATLTKPLGKHPEVGDLSDCRKVYFDGTRYRIVCRLEPNEQTPKIVRVISVGRRANLWAYRDAAVRLGRTPGVDAPPN